MDWICGSDRSTRGRVRDRAAGLHAAEGGGGIGQVVLTPMCRSAPAAPRPAHSSCPGHTEPPRPSRSRWRCAPRRRRRCRISDSTGPKISSWAMVWLVVHVAKMSSTNQPCPDPTGGRADTPGRPRPCPWRCSPRPGPAAVAGHRADLVVASSASPILSERASAGERCPPPRSSGSRASTPGYRGSRSARCSTGWPEPASPRGGQVQVGVVQHDGRRLAARPG